MSRLIDHFGPQGERGEQHIIADLAALERGSPAAELLPKTPMRRRELVPRSTAQPSTRRVRRLDGEKLAAANPLFQPWTTESSKKVLDFSRNISPRKGEPRTRNRLEPAMRELQQSSRRQTRLGANSTLMNATLLSTAISDHDSSSSFSETDIGDVTLPASLQLANQPTEFSQRIARLRQDTCITILEDSFSSEAPESDDHANGESRAETDPATLEVMFEPFSPKDTNACQVLSAPRHQQMAALALGPDGLDKENMDEFNASDIDDDKLAEQLLHEQLCGHSPSSDGEAAEAENGLPEKTLGSPLKASRIPHGPHTPTKDDFWKQSLVDCWNDQHSPRKAVKAAMRSPAKQSSPEKPSKASFSANKSALAIEFLTELDATITEGKIAQMAESTGGVRIEWSKTLSTTAGRANWKKETVRTTPSDGPDTIVTYNHYASIELAEKVIDDEDRLLNVMAHEFCHLANFMISGITNNPHGKEFKYWAAKCSQSFGSRGIKVTTKHTYEIDFKYVWQCEGCSSSYKRHSKSINTDKHRCGGCKGKLAQVKPLPRNAGKPSEYQIFIREEMKALKLANPGSPQKLIMQMAAEKWANKAKVAAPIEETNDDIGDVAAQLLGLSLGQ